MLVIDAIVRLPQGEVAVIGKNLIMAARHTM